METGERFYTKVTDCCGKQTITLLDKTYDVTAEQKELNVVRNDVNTADVIIIGSGMGGTIAALAVDKAGSNFIMLESEGSLGGTTVLSGNHLWFPNLTKTKEIAEVIKDLNIKLIGEEFNRLPTGFDVKSEALKYMASCSCPELYNENYKYLGLPSDIYGFIESFYDNGSGVLENEVLPYIDTLRVKYNAIKGTSYNPTIYDTDMHSLAAGFTLVQETNQTFTATADNVVPGSYGVIPGYCYSLTGGTGFFTMVPDYFDKHDKPGTCVGRTITFYENNGTSHFNISDGGEWIKRVWNYLKVVNERQLLTNKRVINIEEKEDNVVVTATDTLTNKVIEYKAKKGVVIATGGFSHNNDLITKHLMYNKIAATCSANGSRGDIINIAEKNKWDLTQMHHAFFNQRLLNDIGTTIPGIMFFNWFETIMVVNKLGKRVYAETAKYNERAKAHFAWDATHSYINEYLFMVVDRFEYNMYNSVTLGQFNGAKAFSVNDINIPINTKIKTICSDIKSWFQSLPNLADFRIDENAMAEGFIETLNKYHSYCSTGFDLEFSRQNNDSERHWLGYLKQIISPLPKNTPVTQFNDWRFNDIIINALYGATGQAYFDSIATYPYTYPDNTTLNICPDILLQPIIDPVVMVLVPCTLDTKGGPLSNKNMKILQSKGSYIAGNAGGNSSTVNAYWGSGATLGPILVQGWFAGKNAANNDYQSNQDDKFSRNLNVTSFMNNEYPNTPIALDFADPMSFTFVTQNTPNDNFTVLFKLSDNRNENIPKGDNYTSDWINLIPIILNSYGGSIIFKVVLPLNTFLKPGIYLVSFQIIKQNNKSLGPKFATQSQISIIKFNNVNNYQYLGNVLPLGSLLLTQDGSSWTGKFKSLTTSGFPEVSNGKGIYIQYHQPSHNFNLTHAFQFDTLADAILFSNYVYSKGNGESWDGGAMTIIASGSFNFTFDPSPPPGPLPNVVIVANLDIGFTQSWFNSQYHVNNNGMIFPKNEVSNYAYITTDEVVKNWYFNLSLTQLGKWTVYFYYCYPHRQSSSHYGWFIVNP